MRYPRPEIPEPKPKNSEMIPPEIDESELILWALQQGVIARPKPMPPIRPRPR